MDKSYLVVIPARYESKRFPGKPLVDIDGYPMIVRTAQQVEKAVGKDKTIVATDDIKIKNVVSSYGYQVVMTSDNCLTGTDRVAEASKEFSDIDFFINVQGDEPLIDPQNIIEVINYKKDNFNDVITGVTKVYDKDDFFNPNIVKMVSGENNNLLYASRSPIPITKDKKYIKAYKHLPLYAFNRNELDLFYKRGQKSKTPLESIEDVEILRFLEIGLGVKTLGLYDDSISVDVPSDVSKVLSILQ